MHRRVWDGLRGRLWNVDSLMCRVAALLNEVIKPLIQQFELLPSLFIGVLLPSS